MADSNYFTITINSNTLPAWVPPAGSFTDASTSPQAQGVLYPTNATIQGTSGSNGPWVVWTTGVWASEFGAQGSYLCWGGGHQAYYGNEVYCWDLATRTWSRLNDPVISNSIASDGSIGGTDTPAPSHNYKTLGYITNAQGGGPYGSMIACYLPATGDDGNGRNVYWWEFSLDSPSTGHWVGPWLSAQSEGIQTGTNTRMSAQFEDGYIWWLGGGYMTSLYRVNTVTKQVTSYSVSTNTSAAIISDIVPSQRIIVGVVLQATGTYRIYLFNLAAIEAGQTGSNAVKYVNYPSGGPSSYVDGLCWVPDLERFAYFPSQSGAVGTVYWLVPSNPDDIWNSTWSWQTETFSSYGGAALYAITDGSAQNGGWGRVKWISSLQCLLYSATRSSPMQVFRPTGT